MPTVDGRPGILHAAFRPGNEFVVTLTGTAGWLASRTFTATLDGTALSVVESGDDLVVTASAAITAAITGGADFVLTDGDGNDQVVGKWSPRTDGSAHSDVSASVVVDSVTATIDILGSYSWWNVDGGAANTIYSYGILDGGNASVDSYGASIADEINDGETSAGPSQNAVFDALALKADAADISPQLNLPGLWGWWSPRYVNYLPDGNRLYMLSDLSGNSRHLIPSTSANQQPTYETNEVNSLPVARFDGSAGALTVSATAAQCRFMHGTAFTWIVVFERTGAGTGTLIDTNGGGTTGNVGFTMSFDAVNDSIDVMIANAGTLVAMGTANGSWTVDGFQHVCVIRYGYGMAGDDCTIELDGVSIGTANSGGVPAWATDATGGTLSVGQRASTALDKCIGDLAEAMVWDRRLTDAEVLTITGPLETTYGL